MECERPPMGFEALPAPIRPTLSKIVKSIGVRWYLGQTNDFLLFFKNINVKISLWWDFFPGAFGVLNYGDGTPWSLS